MNKISEKNNFQFRIIILLLVQFYITFILLSKSKNHLAIISFDDIFNISIKTNTILIIELNEFHHECTPGYAKYFIDLGYNVDSLIHVNGIDSFSLFNEVENVRLLTFKTINQIEFNAKNLSIFIKKYDYVLLQSNYIININIYEKLEIFKLNNTFFVSHELVLFDKHYSNYSQYLNPNRIWTLGNFTKGLRVNPHYFGHRKIKNKNDRIRFFLTSTNNRNYSLLIKSVELLQKEKYNFELIITGRSSVFNSSYIPSTLNDTFLFKLGVSYSKLYKAVESSDFIIIPLDPNNRYDDIFKNSKVTGSLQLMLGFLKPVIINQEFAFSYNLNKKNSLIYTNNDLYNTMKKAILLNNKEYKYLQKHLLRLEKEIYKTSINNIKKEIIKL